MPARVWHRKVYAVRSYKHNLTATAKHLHWQVAKLQAAVNYAEAFPDEIDEALAEYSAVNFTALKRMLPQAVEFTSRKAPKR
jgi:hypothetical protein